MAKAKKRSTRRRREVPRTDRRALDESSAEALVNDLAAQGISRAKIGGFELDGILRGKYVSLDKLRPALKGGFGFCDVIFGWDVADMLYDNSRLTGWHTGYPDAH